MTVSVLRPNATVSAPGTVVGAASAHAALSDNLDTSYCEVAIDTTLDGTVEMGTFTLPAGAVVSATRCRLRAKSLLVGGNPVGYVFASANPANLSVQYSTVTSSAMGTSFTEISGGYQTGSRPSTQALIDGLKMVVSLKQAHIAETYLDVMYVAKPVTVVSAVTPDPYTASNIVPIAWVNTLDSDGGVQTRYRVKVFTAAQYGIGGFDPETSPFTSDSGEVLGSGLTANVGPLPTGVTYRAYVKVAQTVNGVSHWSAYAFDQFQVTVTTSDVSTVTTVANNPTAAIAVTVTRNGGSSAWNFVELQRSVDAGTIWTPVRGATYVDSTGDADTFVVTDYETANAQSALYRARATRILSSLPITGVWVQSTPAVSWTSTSAWLKSPLNPANNVTIIIETPFSSQERAVRGGLFDVIGLRTPVVISDVLSSPSSSVLIRTDTSVELAAMLLSLADVNLLFQPLPESLAGPTLTGSQYISVVDVSEDQRVPFYTQSRLWNVSYVEIDAPADPLAGSP